MPFLKMSYLKIKQKDIHKVLVIFRFEQKVLNRICH